jgi:hypothetical protein
VCDELVQNIDLAPTYFELAEAKKPDAYHFDGTSLTPLFENGKASGWRDHVYLEMGAARATVTKDWSYIAVRHTKEQVAAIEKASPQNLPKALSYIGRLGIGVRGADHPGFFEEDQLYNLKNDPKEMLNLANNERQADRLREMRSLMKQDLEAIGRPFGEFIPGLNTSPPGQINEQLALVKQIEIQGKKITVPEALRGKAGETDQIKMDNKIIKKAKREERKKSRQAGMKKNSVVPVRADVNGVYPVPMPGKNRYEYRD